MLIFCHLFIGVIIGTIAFMFIREKKVIVLTALGSVLPDLIDKPLGHLLLKGTLDYGRIYAHGLIFLFVLICFGLIYFKSRGTWIYLFIAVGVLSHLVLDSMWDLPVVLLYPFLGDFGTHHFPNYIEDSFWNEVTNIFEWTFASGALAIIMYFFAEKLTWFRELPRSIFPKVAMFSGIVLIPLGSILIALAILGISNPLTYYQDLGSNLILGCVSVIGGAAVIMMNEYKTKYRLEEL